jgi:hypothetical protein
VHTHTHTHTHTHKPNITIPTFIPYGMSGAVHTNLCMFCHLISMIITRHLPAKVKELIHTSSRPSHPTQGLECHPLCQPTLTCKHPQYTRPARRLPSVNGSRSKETQSSRLILLSFSMPHINSMPFLSPQGKSVCTETTKEGLL